MNKKKVIADTEQYVKEEMLADATGHDWQHVCRVRNTALQLACIENADLFVVEMAALLHDLDDYKLTGDASAHLPRATRWLDRMGVDPSIARQVLDIITHLSFKGADVATPMSDKEGCVVQDADRLDAIGAIGIARTFAYGGAKGRTMYVPGDEPVQHKSFEEYKNSTGATINHFYEKLLLLKDRMNTSAAKDMAEKRHQFMLDFLRQFSEEVGL